MQINRSNYEAYFLDYFEKNLSTTEVAELMIFLEANPDLKAEFEDFELLSVSPDSDVVFPQKEILKKDSLVPAPPIHAGNYEEYVISFVEKLLSPEEEQALALFLSLNPAIDKELQLYRLTVLHPESQIQFEAKESLKREAAAPVVPFRNRTALISILSVAAGLAVMIMVYLSLQPVGKETRIAQVKPDFRSSTQIPGKGSLADAPVIKSVKENGPAMAQSVSQPKGNTGKNLHGAREQQESAGSKEAAVNTDHQLSLIPGREAKSIAGLTTPKAGIKSKQRNEYSELYNYYMIRNQLEYAQHLDDQESRSLLARTVSSVRESFLGEEEFNPDAGQENTVGWAMADLGVKGFNALTNSDLRLIRKTNPEGRTLSYAIKSERAEYSKSVDK